MLINLSNHPLETWSEAQRAEAERRFGRIVDIPFPQIPPEWETEQVVDLAREYVQKGLQLLEHTEESSAVHVMGEMTFTFAVVALFQRKGIPCVASTTQRKVTILEDGSRRSVFQFVHFRLYPQQLCVQTSGLPENR